jgi:uncharacterized membrane protein
MPFLNLLLLLAVSVIPFPTAVVGEWIPDKREPPVAAALIGGVLLLMGLAFGSIWMYAVHHHDVAMVSVHPAVARLAIPPGIVVRV